MNKLSTKNWKEFIIGDVFDITLGTPVHKINIGAGSIFNKGIPYVTRTSENNGVEFFVTVTNETTFKKNKGNVLTVGAEAGESFYREDEFITGNKINILANSSLNQFNGLFIKKCLDLELKIKFNYGRGATKERLKRATLKLPSKNGKPDWKFMEDYIKDIYKKVEREVEKESLIDEDIRLDIENWEWFGLKDIFKIRGTKTTEIARNIKCGIYDYISATEQNNGKIKNSSLYNESGNVLTSGRVISSNFFYQKNKFMGSENIKIFEPKDKKFNKFSAMFLITILNLEKFRFNYGRVRTDERLDDLKIKLPSKNGSPDWKFMEDYIKTLPYSKNL